MENVKKDDKDARQGEFTKLHIKEEAELQKELLNKIRGKHGAFQIGIPENEKWVHKALREIPGEEKIDVIKKTAQLCQWSPEAFEKIYQIYWDASPRNLKAEFNFTALVNGIKNFHNGSKKLIDVGVDPKSAVYFAGSHTPEQVDQVLTGIEKLKTKGIESERAFLFASRHAPQQTKQIARSIEILTENRVSPQYAFEMDVAGLESKFRREEIQTEFRENTEKFLGMVSRNVRELRENWKIPRTAKISGASAFEAAAEIASEKGLAKTDKIVDEIIEACKKYGSVYERYKAYRPNYDVHSGEEWLLAVLNNKQPLTSITRKSFETLEPESKTAYSIVGLAAGGLTPELSARIGSMNTQLALETSKILLEKHKENYGEPQTRLKGLQNVYNSLWSLGKDELEPQLDKTNEAAVKYWTDLGALTTVMLHIFKSGKDTARLWLDEMPTLLKLDDKLGPRAAIKAVEAVKTSEQLDAFLKTFNKLESEIFDLRNQCFLSYGKWRYHVTKEDAPSPPGMEMIGEYYNKGSKWESTVFDERGKPFLPVHEEGEGALDLVKSIPVKDERMIISEMRRRTTYTSEHYVDEKNSGMVGDRIFHAEGNFPVYLDMQHNFARLFKKQFFEIFARDDMPLGERLEVAREEMEKFKREFSKIGREVKITTQFRRVYE
ncbi:hypothetical protein H0N98_02120 [Candidatus Micrarchaeota archaeon]|nr:hypothetical protein [Candidatus Micrarchaeota archaeon]